MLTALRSRSGVANLVGTSHSVAVDHRLHIGLILLATSPPISIALLGPG
jgi:hypothetical protein